MSPPMTPAPTTCTRSMRHLGLAAQALEPLLQQEHAHQVARGVAHHELRDGARFGFVGGLATRAMRRPQVDDGVGRRVVFGARLGAHLRDQLLASRAPRTSGQDSTRSSKPRPALLGLAR